MIIPSSAAACAASSPATRDSRWWGRLATELKRWELVGAVRRASRGEVAAPLFVSGATVKTHLLHICDKLGVRGRAAAVGEAYRRRLLP